MLGKAGGLKEGTGDGDAEGVELELASRFKDGEVEDIKLCFVDGPVDGFKEGAADSVGNPEGSSLG